MFCHIDLEEQSNLCDIGFPDYYALRLLIVQGTKVSENGYLCAGCSVATVARSSHNFHTNQDSQSYRATVHRCV